MIRLFLFDGEDIRDTSSSGKIGPTSIVHGLQRELQRLDPDVLERYRNTSTSEMTFS